MVGTVRSLSPLLVAVLSFAPCVAFAHDLELPIDELLRGVGRIDKTLAHLRRHPAIPPLPESEDDQRRVLGAAEIELALGHERRALEMLMGRLADPRFHGMKEYVETLLFTSEILESIDEAAGAMQYAELALHTGGTPDQMAEAGARWFRLARRHQRIDRRLELYDLWRAKNGDRASGSDVSAQVMYEVAWALRADGRRKDARGLLARVPSESSVGSRAAYLAGVTFVEDGDLANAERWFAAVMDWGLPELPPEEQEAEHSATRGAHERRAPRTAAAMRRQMELELRELAALSAGRLRFERGDLAAAEQAYAQVSEGSRHQAEACWERAFLGLERGARRAALANIQCVLDLGAEGSQYVGARLFRASILAHLSRYGDSIEAYRLLHADMERVRDLFAIGAREIVSPARFLFDAMERTAVGRGEGATPGPPTLFGDAWTPLVDQAYRVHRGEREASDELGAVEAEVASLSELLARDDAFVALDVRRAHLARLIREIQHLLGHAGDLRDFTRVRHASAAGVTTVEVSEEHAVDASVVDAAVRALDRLLQDAEADLKALERVERERRGIAGKLLGEVKGELGGIRAQLEALEREATRVGDQVARAALGDIRRSLEDAAMRAEVGVLDTYWLKKEHRTQAIEALLARQKEDEQLADEAMRAAEEEMRSDDERDRPAEGTLPE